MKYLPKSFGRPGSQLDAPAVKFADFELSFAAGSIGIALIGTNSCANAKVD
jgi:hypothetical protein